MVASVRIRETFYEPIFATSQGQVLRFLARHSGRSFFEQEIVENTGVSRSAVNLAARSLWQAGLLHRQRRGRMNFYSADDHHPFVRQFKVLDTLARLEPLLQELRPLARRIVLFGSCAAGTNTAESDIDLFILSRDREQVMRVVRRHLSDLPIQAIVLNHQEMAEASERDRAFLDQIERGLVLWEEGADELGA